MKEIAPKHPIRREDWGKGVTVQIATISDEYSLNKGRMKRLETPRHTQPLELNAQGFHS